MAFQFRLQAVQKVHEFQRDSEKQTLAELLAQQNQLMEKEKEKQKQLQDTQAERCARMHAENSLSPDELLRYFQFESHLKRELAELTEKKEELAQEIETQRASVLASEQEVKKFEKLEEKQRDEYRKKHTE